MGSSQRVALVSMPWAPILEPSLGLGIVSSCLDENGISNKVFHFNLELLKYVKYTTYQSIAEIFGANESIFMEGLNGQLGPGDLALIASLSRTYHGVWKDARTPDDIYNLLVSIRSVASGEYLDLCLATLQEYRPSIVGFTCMFDQIGPSLALAAKVRNALPEAKIVLGGYSVSGPISSDLERLEFVDYVYVGEAEERFSGFCRAIFEHNYPLAKELSRQAKLAVMENSPTPKFDDFFEHLGKLKIESKITVATSHLPIDSSRGCWWGQKNHCTFCGIRGSEMLYRHKSVERLSEQVTHLHSRHGSKHFRISDYILPRQYLESESADILSATGFDFAAEMKSNINERMADNLARAGFSEIQIGVESFSDQTLKSISKGVSGLNNLCAIRLLNERGISVIYNIIYGFDFEDLSEHLFLAENCWRLHHLSPPTSFVKLAYTADSPLTNAGLKDGSLRPHSSYELAYPSDQAWCAALCRENVVYYFEGQPYNRPDEVHVLGEAIAEWRRAKNRGAALTCASAGGRMCITDTRRTHLTHALTDLQMNAMRQLGSHVRRCDFVGDNGERFDDAFVELWDMGLVYIQDSKVVSLVSV
jgi:ribosomal peptide maturation radical SAM protein 1